MSSDRPVTQIEAGAFVGREAELPKLRNAFDRAASGSGSLAMVVGEPGIGKTALCEQLAAHAERQGGITLVGHCYEGEGAPPYWPWLQVMRTYVEHSDAEHLTTVMGPGAEAIGEIVPELRSKLPDLGPPPTFEPDSARFRLFDSIATYLKNASIDRPMVLILEDLSWADASSLALLEHVAGTITTSSLLIVGTYRDIEVSRDHPLSRTLGSLVRNDVFQSLQLDGLSQGEVGELVTLSIGTDAPREVAERLHRITEGNALFVNEILKLGLNKAQGWQFAIPQGITGVINRRFDGLSGECKRVLTVASVIGREFDFDLLSRMTDSSDDDLLDIVDEAVNARVIEDMPGAIERYRFSHALIEQTLNDEQTTSRRARLHSRIGEALEDAYGQDVEVHASELVGHFSRSSRRQDSEKALRYGEIAAARAMSVYAYSEASRLLEQALDIQHVLDADDNAKRCDLLLALGDALSPADEFREVMDAVAPEAFALAEALEDRVRASRACQIALDAINRYGSLTMFDTPEYVQWVTRADRYAGSGTTEQVFADMRLLRIRSVEGKLTEARALALGALALARELEDSEALHTAAVLLLFTPPQHDQERLRLVREVSSHDQAGVTAGTLGLWLIFAGYVLLDLADRAGAEAMWEQLGQHAQRTNDAGLLLPFLITRSNLAYIDGRLDVAVSGAQEMLRAAEQLGAPVVGRQLASGCGWRPLLHSGRGREALTALVAAAELAGVDTPPLFELRRVQTLAHLGHTAEAQGALRGVVAEPRIGFEDENLTTQNLVVLLETAILVGDRELCSVLSERLAPAANLSTALQAYTCPARHLGAAAALLGRPDSSRKYYYQALEAAGKIRFRPEIALTRLQLCELLLEYYPDERPEAMEHLEFVIAELRDMKMQPALERALGLQAALEAKPVGKPAYPDGLTQREVEVLRHIIAGATNQDIAGALFITTNTVANHVKNILSKSNTDNRTAAATYGVRHGFTED